MLLAYQISLILQEAQQKAKLQHSNLEMERKRLDDKLLSKITLDDINNEQAKLDQGIIPQYDWRSDLNASVTRLRKVKALNVLMPHICKLLENSINLQYIQKADKTYDAARKSEISDELIPDIATVVYAERAMPLKTNKPFVDFVSNNIEETLVAKSRMGDQADIQFRKWVDQILPSTFELADYTKDLFKKKIEIIELNTSIGPKAPQPEQKSEQEQLKEQLRKIIDKIKDSREKFNNSTELADLEVAYNSFVEALKELNGVFMKTQDQKLKDALLHQRTRQFGEAKKMQNYLQNLRDEANKPKVIIPEKVPEENTVISDVKTDQVEKIDEIQPVEPMTPVTPDSLKNSVLPNNVNPEMEILTQTINPADLIDIKDADLNIDESIQEEKIIIMKIDLDFYFLQFVEDEKQRAEPAFKLFIDLVILAVNKVKNFDTSDTNILELGRKNGVSDHDMFRIGYQEGPYAIVKDQDYRKAMTIICHELENQALVRSEDRHLVRHYVEIFHKLMQNEKISEDQKAVMRQAIDRYLGFFFKG